MISVVRLDAVRWGLKSPGFSPALVKVGHAIPGLAWDPKERCWAGYGDAVEIGVQALRNLGLDVGPFEIGKAIAPVKTPGHGPLPWRNLRTYQRAGVNFLLKRGEAGCILADDMGLGKTPQAATAARVLSKRTLVVCPSGGGLVVGTVWLPELAKWWPGSKVFEAEGVKDPTPIPSEVNVVLVHYAVLRAWVEVLNAWGVEVAIFDECHALMSPDTQRSKAAMALRAKYRWGLSGTPMTNRPKDLWGVSQVISPGRFGDLERGFFGYGVRYCGGEKKEIPTDPPKVVWDFSGKSNLPELRGRLSWWMLRREAAEVALELPPVTRSIMWVKVGGKALSGRRAAPSSLRELRGLLDRAADRKLPKVLELVKETREGRPDGSTVVFCHRRAVAEWIGDRLKGEGVVTDVLHGGVSTPQRLKRLEAAKAWPPEKKGVLCVTIDSCGVAISLAFARVAIFAELVYEPWKLRQAEKRVARFGGVGAALMIYPLARGTADELILGKVLSKLDTEKDLGLESGELEKDFRGEKGEDERILEELYGIG